MITCLLPGTDGTFGGWRWLMYRVGRDIVLQDQLILSETVPGFDPNDPYDTIEPRESDGAVSEWTVPFSAIEKFAQSAKFS